MTHAKGRVVDRPRWLARTSLTPTVLRRDRRLGRFAYRLALASTETLADGRFAPIASSLGQAGGSSVSVAVTASGRGNGRSLSAVALATLWARWNYHTALIDLTGPESALGRELASASPSLPDILSAVEDRRQLPSPPLLTSALDRLEAFGNSGLISLPRLIDSGLLAAFDEALRDRYQRIVWCLPSIGHRWSVGQLNRVIDRYLIAGRRGRASRRSVEELGRQIAEQGGPTGQLIWFR